MTPSRRSRLMRYRGLTSTGQGMPSRRMKSTPNQPARSNAEARALPSAFSRDHRGSVAGMGPMLPL